MEEMDLTMDEMDEELDSTEAEELEEMEGEDILPPETEELPPADELDAITDDPDFAEWCSQITADLDQETLAALWKDVEDRTPREVELADAALHPDFESQKIFLTDDETGQALRDEEGNWLTAGRRLAGSQAPDGFLEDEEGIHLREQKNYTSAANLLRNIASQTADRRAAFGQDVDLTYILAPHFTVEEAEKIQQYCENELGVSIEWQD